jgi:hypothetical protein
VRLGVYSSIGHRHRLHLAAAGFFAVRAFP